MQLFCQLLILVYWIGQSAYLIYRAFQTAEKDGTAHGFFEFCFVACMVCLFVFVLRGAGAFSLILP